MKTSILGWGLLATVTAGVAAQQPPPPQPQPQPLTTVILVRHAEKVVSDLEDPPLTAAGEERARELAHALGALTIDAVYSTPFRRTLATAEPLAALGHEVVVTPVTPTYAADVAGMARAEHAGGVVVVVSHSNTIPEIIRALGVEEAPEIPESDYDDLFVVTFSEGCAPRLLSLRYGRESP
jgi:broad specificity phosphatase PhoE